jgi:hypothetical protein
MPSLPEIQRAFGDALADARAVAALARLIDGSAEDIAAGLAVYRGNVSGNLAQALAGAYPVVRELLGAEFFEALARAYGRGHPSTSGDLNEYGAALAGFVERFPHTQDLPYLADLARLEWRVHRAYYAADAAAFDSSRLAKLSEATLARLRPMLAPGCALLASPWPVGRIWLAHRDPEPIALDAVLDGAGDRVAVHRVRWTVAVSVLAAGDHAFLAACERGATLAEALAAGAAADREFDFAAALARWVGAGVIADLAA